MQALQQVAARQAGVVTAAQVSAAGLSEKLWHYRITAGGWQRLLPGVAVTHTGEPTSAQLAWAAVLSAGQDARLTGDAALVQVGLKLSELKLLDVVVPHRRRVVPGVFTNGPEIRVMRARAASRLPSAISDIPAVVPHAAVLHAAALAATDRDAEWRLAAVVQQRISAPVLIREHLLLLPQLKRKQLVREVLDDVELGAHAGSELAFLRFLREHGLPLPDELQLRVRAGRATHFLDARYRRQRITFELDGAHHRDVASWQADALRTLRVAAALPGEQVLRLTPFMLRNDCDELAKLLRVLLCEPVG